MAQDGDFAAPATVSNEAKAAIAAFSRTARNNPLPAPTDLEGWKKAHAGIEEDFAEASDAVKKQYQPQIEERKLLTTGRIILVPTAEELIFRGGHS